MVQAEPSRTRAPRGSAREALVGAAADLWFAADLDDLASFITVSRLREATGLSTGAVYSAFPCGADGSDAGRSAPRRVARHALLCPPGDPDRTVAEALELVGTALDAAVGGPLPLPEVVARLVALPAVEGARGDFAHEFSQGWLLAAVALNDPDAADELRRSYLQYQRTHTPVVIRLLELAGREPVHGLQVDELAAMLTSVLDGCAFRLRFDRDRDEEFIVRLLLGLWTGLTRPVGDEDHLLGGRAASPAADLPLAPEQRDAVEGAVRRLHDRDGWSAVTLQRVAELAAVPASQLVAAYPDRHRLAPLVWSGLAESLRRRSGDRGTGPGAAPELVRDLAATACANRAVTASLLQARLAGQAGPEQPATAVVDDLAHLLAGAVPGGASRSALVVEAVLGRAAVDDATTPETLADAVLPLVAAA